jgi:hypothetical protein
MSWKCPFKDIKEIRIDFRSWSIKKLSNYLNTHALLKITKIVMCRCRKNISVKFQRIWNQHLYRIMADNLKNLGIGMGKTLLYCYKGLKDYYFINKPFRINMKLKFLPLFFSPFGLNNESFLNVITVVYLFINPSYTYDHNSNKIILHFLLLRS